MSATRDGFEVVWGKAEVITPQVLSAGTLSVTAEPGNFPASVIFDGAKVELQPSDCALSAVWMGTIRLPVSLSNAPGSIWFKSDLRGMLAKGAGARILLVADLNGELFTKEFSFEETIQAGSEESDLLFEFVHQASALPVNSYAVTIMLLAERRAPEHLAIASVDSLEIVINPDFSPTSGS